MIQIELADPKELEKLMNVETYQTFLKENAD